MNAVPAFADVTGSLVPTGDLGSPSIRILVTGASGNLGGALARKLAKPGTHLLLWGRNRERLAHTGDACRERGAGVDLLQLDLTDLAAVSAALASSEAAGPISEALLVSGLGDALAPDRTVEPAEQIVRLVGSNFSAPAALAAALASRMAARGSGKILLVGSAAALHWLPNAAGYASSKAGLAHFACSLRLAVAPKGVAVTLVSPGFIDWPEGGRPVPRLLRISLDKAADRILTAFAAEVGHAVIPRRFKVLLLLDRLLPESVRGPLLRRLKP